MPKATSKKKKYNARFPPARIKKIMQMDEEVGKVAAAVPVIISRALEMFIESLVTETSKVTRAKNAKTLSTSHIKQTITGTKQFDFLRDLVQNVPDHQADDNGESSFERDPPVQKRAKGRPRSVEGFSSIKSRGNKATSDEEDDDDDDAEDTETDDESTDFRASHPADVKPNTSHLPGAQPNVSYAPSLQQSNVQPNNIDQLLQAASSLRQQQYHHSPHLPSVSDSGMSQTKNNNNNNYVPSSAAGSASFQDITVIGNSYISGSNFAPVLHHQSLPLSSDSVPPSSLSEMKPPLHQMPSNLDSPLPSHCTPKLPSSVSYYNSSNNSLSNPSYIQSPVSQKLLQQQHQPIDLSRPLRQNLQVKAEDDYDT